MEGSLLYRADKSPWMELSFVVDFLVRGDFFLDGMIAAQSKLVEVADDISIGENSASFVNDVAFAITARDMSQQQRFDTVFEGEGGGFAGGDVTESAGFLHIFIEEGGLNDEGICTTHKFGDVIGARGITDMNQLG